MALHVVKHHGHFRSLSNRHLDAQRQTQHHLPTWVEAEYKVTVRIWPLTPNLRLHGVSIADKCYDANSTREQACRQGMQAGRQNVTSAEWTGKEDSHPFWLITRRDKATYDVNVEVVC